MEWYHWWCHWYRVMLMLVPIVSHDQKSCYTSFQLFWPKKWMVPLTVLFYIRWQWFQWHQMTKEVITPHFDYHDLGNAVVPLMPSASCDADTGTNNITWPRSHVAPYLNCLDLEKAMMTLMMLLALCGTVSDPSGIMWHQHQWHHVMQMPVAVVSHYQKSPSTSNFDCGIVTLRMLTRPCGATTCANGIIWKEKSLCTSFLSSWPKQCSDAIDIKWQCCLHHMMLMPVPMASYDQESHLHLLSSWHKNIMVPFMML